MNKPKGCKALEIEVTTFYTIYLFQEYNYLVIFTWDEYLLRGRLTTYLILTQMHLGWIVTH